MDLSIGTTFKYIKILLNIKDILLYAYHFCLPAYRIIVFGASGTGKTQLIAQMRGLKLKDQGMTSNVHKHKITLKGRRIILYDAPGHKSMQDARERLKDMITKEKIKGVINVVSYGYAEREDVDLSKIFQTGSLSVKDDYLRTSRKYEIEQLKEWANSINSDNRIRWIITLINKADIWSDKEMAVYNYYFDDSPYRSTLARALEHCEHHVLKYCCRIEPFYDQPMLLHKGEKYVIGLRQNFKDELVRLILEDDDANAE